MLLGAEIGDLHIDLTSRCTLACPRCQRTADPEQLQVGDLPLVVVEAYVAVAVAIFIFGIPAAMQQHRYSPIMKDTPPGIRVEWSRVVIVFAILIVAILSNVTANLRFPAALDRLPVIGLAVWVVILVTTPWRTPDWKVMPETFQGTIFLLALVTSASLMPVETLYGRP